MRLTKSITFSVPLIFISVFCFAAPQLAVFQRLEGKFQQTKLIRELDLEIKTSGDFQVHRPQGRSPVFIWNILLPKPSKICIDDVGIVMNQKNLKFSEVGSETGAQISGMLKIISMDAAKIEEAFVIEKLKSEWTLTSKQAGASFFESAKLSLDDKGLVKELQLTEKSKDTIKIRFSDLKTKFKNAAKVDRCPR